MTTTNIGGIGFPDDMLAEAAAVADGLDGIMPDLMALLDRAAASYNAMEIVMVRSTGFGISDETWEAIRTQTGFGRFIDHWYDLAYRLDDSNLISAELTQVQQEYMESPEGRARTAEMERRPTRTSRS